jgi:hypothetical protein
VSRRAVREYRDIEHMLERFEDCSPQAPQGPSILMRVDPNHASNTTSPQAAMARGASSQPTASRLHPSTPATPTGGHVGFPFPQSSFFQSNSPPLSHSSSAANSRSPSAPPHASARVHATQAADQRMNGNSWQQGGGVREKKVFCGTQHLPHHPGSSSSSSTSSPSSEKGSSLKNVNQETPSRRRDHSAGGSATTPLMNPCFPRGSPPSHPHQR